MSFQVYYHIPKAKDGTKPDFRGMGMHDTFHIGIPFEFHKDPAEFTDWLDQDIARRERKRLQAIESRQDIPDRAPNRRLVTLDVEAMQLADGARARRFPLKSTTCADIEKVRSDVEAFVGTIRDRWATVRAGLYGAVPQHQSLYQCAFFGNDWGPALDLHSRLKPIATITDFSASSLYPRWRVKPGDRRKNRDKWMTLAKRTADIVHGYGQEMIAWLQPNSPADKFAPIDNDTFAAMLEYCRDHPHIGGATIWVNRPLTEKQLHVVEKFMGAL